VFIGSDLPPHFSVFLHAIGEIKTTALNEARQSRYGRRLSRAELSGTERSVDMDYVKPQGVVESMLAGGVYKLNVPPRHLILRGMLAGAYLGIGTSMAVTAAVETGYWIVGSILFPFGLALAILLGAEIITGSFALLPCAAAAGKENAGTRQVLINWGLVFLGNLLGSTLYAVLFAIAITTGGDAPINAVGTKLIAIAEAKTNYYAAHGSAGLLAVFTKGILCNWMVSLAVVAAFMSTSFSGKMIAIWGRRFCSSPRGSSTPWSICS
jgi:formate/nitrite transporter FocA (FNT family)